VLLEWQTGYEVENLGFNIFREENGKRSRVNPRLVAGSALLIGPGTRLGAGYTYAWKDLAPGGRDAVYWLEDVDLKGQSTWHGPVAIRKVEGNWPKAELARQSATLDGLNHGALPDTSSLLEARAHTAPITSASIGAQGALASQAAAEIAIRREGWYRVTQPELAAIGFNTRVNPRLLQLFVDGLELPIAVRGEQDGSFNPGDSVEFYGMGLDSAFTDSRVYWLVAGDQAGLRVNQNKTEGVPSSSQSFTATVERRDRNVYFPALRNGERENFFGAVIARDPVELQLTLSHVAGANSGDATVEIALQGVTLSPHRVRVDLNGAQLGEVIFDGQSESALRFIVSQSSLREDSNTVRLTTLAGGSDVSLVDYTRISYQHSYTADNDALKLTAAGGQQITIDGFASKSIRLFDVTDANSPEELMGEIKEQTTGYSVTFASRCEGQGLVLASTGEQRPASLVLNQPSSFRKGKASYLIVTRRDFFDSLQPLVALRESQGLRVAVVDVEDIYDEFNFGQKSPVAIRDFLANAKTNWKKKPRFVLFAGDASLDPKTYLGHRDSDLVPTKLIDTDLMETSSDDWFSDFDDGGIAGIASGRLPAGTTEELSLMVAKIIRYERADASDEALLVADANEGCDFEAASAQLKSLIPASLKITQVNRGRLDAEVARTSLIDALNRKQFVVNYVGHGSVNQWKANLLTNAEALALRNEHLPMFVMMTCLNGYFQDPALDSLAESLLKAQGGAVAV
jgi:hypothetical protein